MPDIMKDNSFDSAMDKIVGQALAEQQRELLAQQRRMEFAKYRTIGWSLAGAVALIFVATHEAELQRLVTTKLNSKPAISATVRTLAVRISRTRVSFDVLPCNATLRV